MTKNNTNSHLPVHLIQQTILIVIVFLLLSCGGGGIGDSSISNIGDELIGDQQGSSEKYSQETAINATEIKNKNLFAELAEIRGKQPITIEVVENVAILQGVMDSTIPVLIQNLINSYPEVDTLILQHIPGTIDFHATIEAGRIVRNACLKTVVPYKGKIASGGVHFFFAGCERIVETGGKLGIHTWKYGKFDDEGNLTESKTANEYDTSDPIHQIYLDYQAEMGIPEDFYWFMVDVPFDNMHYLSRDEIDQYLISTEENNSWGANYRLVLNSENPLNIATARFYVSEEVAIIHGQISSQTAINLEKMLIDNPQVSTIEFGYLTGTTTNTLQPAIDLGLVIRDYCLTTKVSDSSVMLVDSIHAYLAGCTLEFQDDAQIEIASWINSDNESSSKNNSLNEELHVEYRDYYGEMGIPVSFYDHQIRIPKSSPEVVGKEELIEFGVL